MGQHWKAYHYKAYEKDLREDAGWFLKTSRLPHTKKDVEAFIEKNRKLIDLAVLSKGILEWSFEMDDEFCLVPSNYDVCGPYFVLRNNKIAIAAYFCTGMLSSHEIELDCADLDLGTCSNYGFTAWVTDSTNDMEKAVQFARKYSYEPGPEGEFPIIPISFEAVLRTGDEFVADPEESGKEVREFIRKEYGRELTKKEEKNLKKAVKLGKALRKELRKQEENN